MAKSMLPLIALAGAAFFLMKKKNGNGEPLIDWPSAKKSILGDLRDIKSTLYHGDLLLAPKEFNPNLTGHTLKITDAQDDWTYGTASDRFDEDAQAGMVEVYHDKAGRALYATFVAGYGALDAGGLGGSVEVVGVEPGGEPRTLASFKH